jgi:NCS1 family nucleobase:cation symporter-1
MPWNLLSDPNAYIFTWLGTYGGATGAIAGVIMADYWWIRRNKFKLAELYKPDGVYRYARGWNWIAVVALLIGVVMAIGGAYSATDGAPFPAGGIIPFLKPFYDYSWVVGLVVSGAIYAGLTLTVGKKHIADQLAA